MSYVSLIQPLEWTFFTFLDFSCTKRLTVSAALIIMVTINPKPQSLVIQT